MLLGFSRRQVVRPRVLDLKASMGELEEGLRRLKGPGVALEFRHAADLRPVKIDPAQLDQVLVQLVLNSREALSERGGRILIETSNSEFDEAFVAGNEGARLGPHVQIAVADDGRGMDPETLAHVFEPFFTTKEPGKGSGLGLAAVYGILKQNDGYVRVESRPGAGTTVRLWLPRVEAVTATPSARADRPEAAVARAGTVLVVEDEWAVRGLVRQVLSRAGFSVLEAGEGQEALDVAAKHGKDIDVLLADAVMPGMGGREVAERLRAERPGLKVILMSGYSWDALMADSDGAAEAEFLSKPFAPDELLARIEGLMKATDRGRS
jgi:CheY-like chemotaxis protein